MARAVNPIAFAILSDRSIVDLPEPRQLGQDVTDKPQERRQLTQVTQRELKVLDSPLTLTLVAGGRESVSHPT